MAAPETPETRGVLRRPPSQGLGTRRLPGLEHGRAEAEEQPDPGATTVAQLRSVFASELAALEQEARARGLAQGRLENAQALDSALTKAREEQARQWLEQEASLRLGLEQQGRRLDTLVQSLEQQSEQLIAAMEPVVGRLALAVVIRFLGQHLVSRSLVADLATQAIEEYRLSEPLRILVSAADYQSMDASGSVEALLARCQIDHGVDPGSCLIDYGSGQLDAGLDSQLAAVKTLLLADAQGEGHVGSA